MRAKPTQILAGFALIWVLGVGVAWVFGKECGVSFLLGYGAFGVIMSGSILHIRRQLWLAQNASQTTHSQDSHDDLQSTESTQANKNTNQTIQTDKSAKIPPLSRFVVGTKLSFSLMRVVGYVLFLAGIGGLLYYDMLMPTGLFAGITIAVVYVVGVGVSVLKSSD